MFEKQIFEILFNQKLNTMKKTIVFIVFVLFSMCGFAQTAEKIEDYFMPTTKVRIGIVDQQTGEVADDMYYENEFLPGSASNMRIWKRVVYMQQGGRLGGRTVFMKHIKITANEILEWDPNSNTKISTILKFPASNGSNTWKEEGREFSVSFETRDGKKMLALKETNRWGTGITYYAKGEGYLYLQKDGKTLQKALPIK